jgi:uncharacterized membrane protein YedE/YeeE
MAQHIQPSPADLKDLQARELDALCVNESALKHPWWYNLKYSAWGLLFGIVFVKAEIISWFRIQEMFRFESFHMYGVIGTAVMVGMLSVFLIRRTKARTIYGEEVHIPNKEFNKGQIYGGLLFGLGWAITGACPGPLFAQVGAGFGIVLVTFVSAVAGTYVYGVFRDKLLH